MPTFPASLRLATLALACGALALSGCARKIDAPEAKVRYEALGPKADFPAQFSGTILEAVDVYGTTPRAIAGYGIVVNLENTGRNDGIPSAVRSKLLDDAVRRGVGVARTDGVLGGSTPDTILADPRTTIVRLDGIVPPGARKGQRIDVAVSALDSNTTPSLARGFLWQTELYTGRVDVQSPGEQVNQVGTARGPLMVNPIHALAAPEQVKDDATARASLRRAVIPDGGVVFETEPFVLKLRNPSRRMARMIEKRINYHFGVESGIAAAQDEALISVRMPESGPWAARGPDDWRHFLGVVLHLYFAGGNGGYAAQQAEELVAFATDTNRTEDELLALSYAWEGLGKPILPQLEPLIDDPDPAVAFYAARAAAHLEDPAAPDALVRMAGEKWNPYNVKATRELGKIPHSQRVARAVRRLLDEDVAGSPQVRLAAYETLVRMGDPIVREEVVGEAFALHTTPGRGTPIAYASRSGRPTIALIGGFRDRESAPRLRPETLVTAFGDRLTISRPAGSEAVSLFQRRFTDMSEGQDISQYDSVQQESANSLREVLSRLGGERLPGERKIRLNYGDVVALLKQMGDERVLVAGLRGEQPVLVRIEDAIIDSIDSAPKVPGLEDLRGRPTARAR